jgi:signal transduction histidine kinase
MLHDFLSTHRELLIERCSQHSRDRYESEVDNETETETETETPAAPVDLAFGIPLFLDQLIKTLRVEQSRGGEIGPAVSRLVGRVSPKSSCQSEIGTSATLHGRELSAHGFTIDQVVHEYGDLCQVITGLALELDSPIQTEEFKTLNRCLDDGIADAVTEFSFQRDRISMEREGAALNQRLGVLAHELRNHLNTATLAFSLVKSGKVAVLGATGAVLERSLIGLRNLIDRSLAEVRLKAGLAMQPQIISVAELVAEIKASASLEADARGCDLVVTPVDHALAVEIDRDLLHSALGNLLQNAFKFTKAGTQVSLSAHAQGDRIWIHVRDHCGGLQPGVAKTMFKPFRQSDSDRTGIGLGLTISKCGVEANRGNLTVRDMPGSGCVFTIDLPRYYVTPLS